MSHFSAIAVYALFASVVFGITQRSEPKMMIRFGAYCFGLFLLAAIAVSWGMYFLKH